MQERSEQLLLCDDRGGAKRQCYMSSSSFASRFIRRFAPRYRCRFAVASLFAHSHLEEVALFPAHDHSEEDGLAEVEALARGGGRGVLEGYMRLAALVATLVAPPLTWSSQTETVLFTPSTASRKGKMQWARPWAMASHVLKAYVKDIWSRH